MKNLIGLKTDEITADTAGPDTISRRTLLTRAAVVGAVGVGASALGLLTSTQAVVASDTPKQPEADSGHDYSMKLPNAKTEAQFRKGVIGPAMLSLAVSKIAVDKATDPKAKEFANFELREAIAVTTVLKSMGTPVPPMDAMAKATLAKIQNTPKGEAFDKVYMTAQLMNHEFLRDHTNAYLNNSMGAKSMMEMHGRHLAMLALGTFKEHVVHCKDFLA